MRIAGGEFGGIVLKTPKTGDIRPTQDRVREALFSMLFGEICGCTFLDLFAGSGSVGLEAVSRGAASATFVERDRRHLAVLRENVASAMKTGDVSKCRIVCCDAYKFLSAYSGPGFDVAFADPPYALGEKAGYTKVLENIATRGVVRAGGLFVAETAASQSVADSKGWRLERNREYGKTKLLIWRRLKDGEVENTGK